MATSKKAKKPVVATTTKQAPVQPAVELSPAAAAPEKAK